MSSHLYRVAIVGASSLKGKELKEVLETSTFPSEDIKLLDTGDAEGQIDAVGDEATLILPISSEQFKGMDIAIFAAEPEFTRVHWHQAQKAGCSVVDMSYALEGEKGIRVQAPWLEAEIGAPATPDLRTDAALVAHPAATVLALILHRAKRAGTITNTPVANLFEPASERGKPGMDELHQQTVNLLSFQSMPKAVFDAQVAFNVVPRYGAASKASLAAVEARILAHYKTIAGADALVPSLMLAQAPIFHAYILSIYIELGGSAGAQDLLRALAGEHVILTTDGQEDDPQNVSAAGHDAVLCSVRRDASRTNGFWIWAAADNLRVSAQNAVECARMLASLRVKGRVQ
jgi:aspartate-semialdehyde dehydrogenase